MFWNIGKEKLRKTKRISGLSLVNLKFTAWKSTCWYFSFINLHNTCFFRKIVSQKKRKELRLNLTPKTDFLWFYIKIFFCVNDEKMDELKNNNNMLKSQDSIRSNVMYLSAQIYQDHMNNISLWTDICISESYLCKRNSTWWTSSSNQKNSNWIFSRGNFPFR